MPIENSSPPVAIKSALPGPGMLYCLDLEALNIPLALEDQLPYFDVHSAIHSLNSPGHFLDPSTDEDNQGALQRFYISAKNSAFSWANLSPSVRLMIGDAIGQLKSTARMVVENNSTLWYHAKLYEEYMPRPLQDACATCALYEATNGTNAKFVFGHLTSRVDELMATPLTTAQTLRPKF